MLGIKGHIRRYFNWSIATIFLMHPYLVFVVFLGQARASISMLGGPAYIVTARMMARVIIAAKYSQEARK
ncbi:hypothetical protein EDB19DRAFT_1711677 [Suillus lakei]|nr:hypothetical protein EDB19DRAFT_1711677 [Suillus lakei]